VPAERDFLLMCVSGLLFDSEIIDSSPATINEEIVRILVMKTLASTAPLLTIPSY
jgi:hypothetical protein